MYLFTYTTILYKDFKEAARGNYTVVCESELTFLKLLDTWNRSGQSHSSYRYTYHTTPSAPARRLTSREYANTTWQENHNPPYGRLQARIDCSY
jgi:hypothetical protein